MQTSWFCIYRASAHLMVKEQIHLMVGYDWLIIVVHLQCKKLRVKTAIYFFILQVTDLHRKMNAESNQSELQCVFMVTIQKMSASSIAWLTDVFFILCSPQVSSSVRPSLGPSLQFGPLISRPLALSQTTWRAINRASIGCHWINKELGELNTVTDLTLSSLLSASVLVWKFIMSATRSLSCCSSWTLRAFSRSRARAAPPSRLCSAADRPEQDTWAEWDIRASSLRMSDKSLRLEGGWQRGRSNTKPEQQTQYHYVNSERVDVNLSVALFISHTCRRNPTTCRHSVSSRPCSLLK